MTALRYEYRHKINDYCLLHRIDQEVVDKIRSLVRDKWGSGKKYLYPNIQGRDYDHFMRRKDQIEYVMLLRYHKKSLGSIEDKIGEVFRE